MNILSALRFKAVGMSLLSFANAGWLKQALVIWTQNHSTLEIHILMLSVIKAYQGMIGVSHRILGDALEQDGFYVPIGVENSVARCRHLQELEIVAERPKLTLRTATYQRLVAYTLCNGATTPGSENRLLDLID